MSANTPTARSDVSSNRLLVVIVNYKSASFTVDCLRSLEPELATIPARAAIIENASGDHEALSTAIRENGWNNWVTLDVSDHNGGFAYGCNRAIRPALASDPPPQYFLLLNPDTRVFPGAVRRLLEFLDTRPGVGIAGCSYERSHGGLAHCVPVRHHLERARPGTQTRFGLAPSQEPRRGAADGDRREPGRLDLRRLHADSSPGL